MPFPDAYGQDILRAKGATNYGISAALTRIATAILRDEHAVLTVSTLVPETMDLVSPIGIKEPGMIGVMEPVLGS